MSIEENRQILVVDDDANLLARYQSILTPSEEIDPLADYFSHENTTTQKKEPYEIVAVSQGEEGIEEVKRSLSKNRPFAVAFIDMRMPPGIDGLETAKAIRELDDRIYVVIVTAYTDRTIDELQEAVQHDILLVRKPFVSEEIYQLARNFCISWERDAQLAQLTRERSQLFQRTLTHATQATLGEATMGALHEINHPITYIGTTVQLLLEAFEKREIDDDTVQRDLRSCHEEVRRIREITSRLQTFSQGDQEELSMEPVDLSATLDHALVLSDIWIGDADIRLTTEVRRPLPKIMGNSGQMEQLFINLLKNAIEATRERSSGQIHITITTSMEDDFEMVVISVSDNGTGIRSEHLDKIFTPFFTTKQSGQGTGIGLSIAHEIVQNHLGEIVCNSRWGEGTELVITFPVHLDFELN